MMDITKSIRISTFPVCIDIAPIQIDNFPQTLDDILVALSDGNGEKKRFIFPAKYAGPLPPEWKRISGGRVMIDLTRQQLAAIVALNRILLRKG